MGTLIRRYVGWNKSINIVIIDYIFDWMGYIWVFQLYVAEGIDEK